MSANVVHLRKSSRLVCSDCGVEASCDCHGGQPIYVTKGEYAARAVAAHPEKSNRALAAEIGVDHKTVGKAREELGTNSPDEPAKRVGLDGKARTLPAKKAPVAVTDGGRAARIKRMVDFAMTLSVDEFCDFTRQYIQRAFLKNPDWEARRKQERAAAKARLAVARAAGYKNSREYNEMLEMTGADVFGAVAVRPAYRIWSVSSEGR